MLVNPLLLGSAMFIGVMVGTAIQAKVDEKQARIRNAEMKNQLEQLKKERKRLEGLLWKSKGIKIEYEKTNFGEEC